MNAISPAGRRPPSPAAARRAGRSAARPARVGSFKNMLFDSLKQVNSMQQEANRAVENLMTGGDVNPAEVLTAVQKADLAFRMMMQVRNKVVRPIRKSKTSRFETLKRRGHFPLFDALRPSWMNGQLRARLTRAEARRE